MNMFIFQTALAVVLLGTALAATPTNCSYGYYCGFGGQCLEDPLVPGTTKCNCYQGYKLSSITFECDDIDECSAPNAAVCPHGRCQNLWGTYKCRCNKGFAPHYPDGKTCERIRPRPLGGLFGGLFDGLFNGQNGGLFGGQFPWSLLLLGGAKK